MFIFSRIKTVIAFLVIFLAAGLSFFVISGYRNDFADGDSILLRPSRNQKQKIKAFKSADDFKNYIAKTSAGNGQAGFGRGGAQTEAFSLGTPMAKSLPDDINAGNDMATPARIGQTNVQVLNIDEPDIAKTNGREIFFSKEQSFFKDAPRPLGESFKIMPDYGYRKEISIIKALPIKEVAKIGKIDQPGTLLLSGDRLIVFSDREIYGYDIASSTAPAQTWKIDLKDRTDFVDARLFDGKIYLVTRTGVNSLAPCPVEPYAAKETPLTIACSSIYHPATAAPAEATYNLSTIDPANGTTGATVAFVGSYDNTAIYMSKTAIYATYGYSSDFIEFIYKFFKANADLVPAEIIARLKKLMSYELSAGAKTTEFYDIMAKLENAMDGDARLKFQNEITNRMDSYYQEHGRELAKTGIVKIAAADLKITANGEVPGRLLNQFSLDEYENHLRAAVTIGENSWWGFGGARQTANDIYVLDDQLKTVGSIKDLGKEERIYSARFLGDRGYLVTFKQVDPFFVLDLSDPKNPQMKGELKIPGYSSYLHPIAKNRILGVGQDNGKVKLSLFDIADPAAPKEIAKYALDEYWTEAATNHHAFTQDEKFQAFFLPGGQGGYVFSYKDDKLELVKAVAEASAKRALYINDNLYVLTDNKIIVLNEASWEKEAEVAL